MVIWQFVFQGRAFLSYYGRTIYAPLSSGGGMIVNELLLNIIFFLPGWARESISIFTNAATTTGRRYDYFSVELDLYDRTILIS